MFFPTFPDILVPPPTGVWILTCPSPPPDQITFWTRVSRRWTGNGNFNIKFSPFRFTRFDLFLWLWVLKHWTLSLAWNIQRSRRLERGRFVLALDQPSYMSLNMDQRELASSQNLNTLPDDVLFAILRYCDIRSLLVLVRVSQNLRRIANDDSVWRGISQGCINVHSSHKK